MVVRGRRPSGTTLVELLVVFVITGLLLAAVTLSTGYSRANRQLDSAARELLCALQVARQTARAHGGATFRLSAGAWSVTDAAGRVTLSGALGSNVVVNTTPGALCPLSFGANGTTGGDGSFALSSATGRHARITVTAATGAIDLSFD
jgi:type II secretory pathway pseudopilin PulG